MIRGHRIALTAAASLWVTGWFAGLAWASPPTSHLVEYKIHEDPEDEESPVVFITSLLLKPIATNGLSVGWAASEAEFTRLEGGHAVAVWRVLEPEIDSTDGLWWVDHADPSEPAAADFATAPHMEGEAERADASGPALSYAFEAGTLGEEYEEFYGGAVAAVTHAYSEIGGQYSLEDDDEPEEVDDGTG